MADMARRATAWRWLFAGEWRASPVRLLLAGLAIAIGVSLGFAVHIANHSAAEAFGEAVRSISGEADLQVRAASPLGLDERLYPKLLRLPEIADASPVVRMRGALGERAAAVTLIGLDPIRAIGVTPTLLGRRVRPSSSRGEGRAPRPDAALNLDLIYLSDAALADAGVDVGDPVMVHVGKDAYRFTVAGDVPGAAAGQPMGVIDIAAAQWRFDRLGTVDRIDLEVAEGVSVGAASEAVEAMLPDGAILTDSEQETRRGDSLSRAYRVNLDMLALVALITGGFLVYSAQSLSVMRRLRQFALLRTIGMRKRSVERQLIGEGLALGLIGSLAGLLLGYFIAAQAMRLAGGDLGGGYFEGTSPRLAFSPFTAFLFGALGVATAIAGSYVPARQAGRLVPAEALKNAGDPVDPRRRPHWKMAAVLILLGVGAAFLPAIGGLPLFGYGAVALIIAGAIAGMPWLAHRLLGPLARIELRWPPVEVALRRLLGAPLQASIALAGIVASTGLMIAMAIMVTSFRGSVETWLDTILSGDLYLSLPSDGPAFDAMTQARLAHVPGVAAISFSKGVPLTVDPKLPPMILIVRPIDSPGYNLPVMEWVRKRGDGIPLWVSEPAARLLDVEPGDPFGLPIGAEEGGARGYVAGIWRDYARQQGAILIDSAAYVALTGDRNRDEAEVELAPGAMPARVRAAIQQRLPVEVAARLSVAEPATLKARALTLFDRSFAITYVLEAIAIAIGLAGVAATVAAQTIARIREFGMLRHIGMRRGQIMVMLAGEGALLGLIGIMAGMTLGLGLSQILIHVINPQSFNWTMKTALPWPLLAGVGAALIASAAGTAVLAGRRILSYDAVRAVSEDW